MRPLHLSIGLMLLSFLWTLTTDAANDSSTLSSQHTLPSNQHALPSNRHALPSNRHAQPSRLPFDSAQATDSSKTSHKKVKEREALFKWRHLRRCRRQKRRGTRLPGSYRITRPYPRRWWRYCRWFRISSKRCRKLRRHPTATKVHALVLDLLQWLLRDLSRTSNRTCRRISKRRYYYFLVKKPRRIPRRYRYSSRKWWWDRYRGRNKQYMMVDIADRLVRSVLSTYPKALYHQLLRRWTTHLYDRAMPMSTENAMVSRISRWMQLRPAPRFAKQLARRMGQLMLSQRSCPWWYVTFMGNFAPEQLKHLTPKISGKWCELRNTYQRLAFATYPQLERKMKHWARNKRFRRIFKLRRIGCTSEGRPLWAYRLGYPSKNKFIPTAVFVGNQHGDEHMGADLTTLWTQELLQRYLKGDKTVLRWFRTRHLWFIPVLNPDGKAFDLLGGMIKWWRFNRSVQYDGQIGVDLNRNFSFKWRAFTYSRRRPFNLPGTHPFSEPETQALRRFIWKIKNMTALLDIHQSGSVLLMPFAHKWRRMPGPYSRWHKRIGKYITEQNHYRVWRARRLYPHYGTLGDWAFARHKALSFVLELGRRRYLSRRGMKKVYAENRLLLERFTNLAIQPFALIDKIWRQQHTYQVQRKRRQHRANH